MIDSEKRAIAALLEVHGIVDVLAVIVEWADEFGDGTKEEYRATAIVLAKKIEEGSIYE